MYWKPIAVGVLAGVLACLASTGTTAADPRAVRPYAPGVVMVKFRARLGPESESSPRLQELLPSLHTARPLLRHVRPHPVGGGVDRLYAVTIPAGDDAAWLAAKLSRLPEVEYAEPRYLYEMLETSAALAVPDDPLYPNQTYLNLLQVTSAWDVVKGEDGDPVVCVVDGGTHWSHEDLAANAWVNPGEVPGNLLDDDDNGFVDDVHGWDFQSDHADPRGNLAVTPNNANHGTHTAGLLAAVTNNAIGMASPSWNPRLMAVNASSDSDLLIEHGFEGIVYAVDNGADIISLSWGGSAASQAGQDVIEYAVSQGVLVLAAAGNSPNGVPIFPAAYRNVYAVANVGHQGINVDRKSSSSNFGPWVDVSAPGQVILSTVDNGVNNAYASFSGTSMATPLAAAVAALIKSQHPAWDGLKVGEQLRVTCDNINAVNPSFVDLLGKGRVNAFRAVTEVGPAVRLVTWTLSDPDGNGQLNRGETVTMSFDVHNYRAAAAGLTFSLTTSSPHVTISDGSQSLGALAEDANASLPGAFTFTVASGAPLGAAVDLRVGISGTGYSDFQWVSIVLEPLAETHDVNRLRMSLTATGGIGWMGFADSPGPNGEGFRFDGGTNCLFEGGLMVGISPLRLADAVHSGGSERWDFVAESTQPPMRVTPGLVSDQEMRMAFSDVADQDGTALGVRVAMETRAFATTPTPDAVIVGYRITNTTAATHAGLRVGLYFDWDIDESDALSNRADWDPARGLGYAWNSSEPAFPHVGVVVLTGGPQVIYGVFEPGQLSEQQKWDMMTGVLGTSAGPGDVGHALTTGPFNLAAGDSVTVWFALLAGHGLAALQSTTDQVRQYWNSILAVEPGALPGGPAWAVGMPAPNPVRDYTSLTFHLDRAGRVAAQVHDLAGRQVRALCDREFGSGTSHLEWNGTDDTGSSVPSGLYFIRLRSGDREHVRRVLMIR